MRVRLILPALLAGALVALTGCGSATHSTARPAAKAAGGKAVQAAGDNAAQAAAVTVPASLKFTGTTLDGKPFDGASMAGRPVVLWFWAPWCATCAGEAPTVADLATTYQGKVTVLGVAGMGPEKDMHQFVTEGDVGNITHLSDNAGVVWKRFGITEQSLYVLIDRTGRVVSKGWLDSLQLPEQVAKLVTT
jgi:thiol-disulfide isomerase/thioredoxin